MEYMQRERLKTVMREERHDKVLPMRPERCKGGGMKTVVRKCRVCGQSYEKRNIAHVVCSPDCAIEYTKRQREKKQAEAERKAKREERVRNQVRRRELETVSDLIKKAQCVFNRYIRLRDKGQPCISCGRQWKENFQACHYIPAGRSSKFRFDADNVHSGCVRCNLYESGNLRGYRVGLIRKIGIDKVISLEEDHEIKKWDKEELRGLISIYKQKIKEIEK